MQISVDTWCAISPLMLFKYLPDLLGQLSIFSLPSADWTFAPGVKAAFRDREHMTHHHDGKFMLVLFNKTIFHLYFREKILTTFFRISRSCCTPVSYTHLRAHETRHDLVCRLLLE